MVATSKPRSRQAARSFCAPLFLFLTLAGPGMLAQGAPAKAADDAGASFIPDVQPGRWKVRVTSDKRTRENETCGDPIDGFRREVREYAANTRWGCTMGATATGPRGAKVVYECPSDRAPDGRPVTKGRTELQVDSPDPQSLRIEMKSTAYPGYVMEATRLGDCLK